ncbi:MAG: sirohydrochlorin chelatase [Scytonema sp. PMC 1069.18]|nr:sirohydrochlorin chelatase [Scytonema sp. PMC 1069.18]MEC4883775.1 sirohydrochlorin chelatase [Scytonema sp. PMC 1070.18]
MASAYLLISHGSRDPRPEIAMRHLAMLLCRKIQAYLARSDVLVGAAYLELHPKPLHEQIRQFATEAIASGCHCLKIIPLFLLPGVHVMEDIPDEVALAKQLLSREIEVHLQPHLGSYPGLERLLVGQLADITSSAKILVAHGSRRPGSEQPVEALASVLGAVTAFWSHPPSLESRVKELITAGYKQIAILPYFLFAGGITDAIALKQQELKLLFPEVSFQLAEPLGASVELADVIWDLVER